MCVQGKVQARGTCLVVFYHRVVVILFSNFMYSFMLQLNEIRQTVSKMAARRPDEVRVVASPYRICPLGAHIDHQVFLMYL